MSALEILREKIISGEFAYKTAREIARLSGVTGRAERESVFSMLSLLEGEGEVVRDEKNRYTSPERMGLVRGVLRGNERGFAFLIREDGCDLFIPHRSLNGAMHGDTVFARCVGGDRGDEGEVYSVIRRGYCELVGTYFKEKKCGYVRPDERKYFNDVRVVAGKCRAYSGEKVVVKITDYPEGGEPVGEIAEILGESGEIGCEETAIIRSHNLAENFSQKTIAEARKAAGEPVSVRGRADFRDRLIITIDGDDSRDFDDAVEVRREGELFVLGVHIADVTHYVKRGLALDKEAYRRGTSVYFPDRVLPMLPEELSNGICSLNEGEDRYTLSCIMKIDGKGKLRDSELATGVIRSSARMTYKNAAAILDGDEALRRKYAFLVPMLEDMRALAEILMKKRRARGSIDLDVKEAAITVDGGKIQVKAYERTFAHRIIEEFMILANETVAEFMAGYEMPFVYRVHEKPATEKAEGFKAYLSELGIKANFHAENVRPGEYGKILEGLEGNPMYHVVNRVMLRSMSKAKYSAENDGHFGLASPCYCHFTSPIRRYPDLLVHRIVKLVLEGRAAEAAEGFSHFVHAAAASCSESERRADEAERDVDELFKTLYMRERLGESFDAVISGVTSFGIFAELSNSVEGLIRLENLPADDYVFVEQRYLLKGLARSYKIGDAVKIKVIAADLGTRKCEFALSDENAGESLEKSGGFGI